MTPEEVLTRLENAVEASTIARMNGRTTNNRKIHAEALAAIERIRAGGRRMRALIDHEYTDELVCPHCGYEVGDSWELPELGRRACGDCGKEFEYEKNVSTSFTSWKVEEQQEVAAGDLNDGR